MHKSECDALFQRESASEKKGNSDARILDMQLKSCDKGIDTDRIISHQAWRTCIDIDVRDKKNASDNHQLDARRILPCDFELDSRFYCKRSSANSSREKKGEFRELKL